MFNTGRYFYKPIEFARKDVIGLKVIDFEMEGKVIHLEDEEGRAYTIDTTGDKGVVHAYSTDQEKIEHMEIVISAILGKLNIDEDELLKAIEE